MRILRKLLDRLSNNWNTEAHDVPALSLSKGTGTHTMVTLQNGAMYLHSATYRDGLPSMATIILDGLTLNDLVSQLNSMGYSASVTSEGQANGLNLRNATALLDVDNVPLTATLNGFTSVTWQIFYPLYRALQDAENDTDKALEQLGITTTSGSWLDYWASFFTLNRYAGETDNNFVRRVLMWLFNPKTNNIAIQELIAYRLSTTPDKIKLNDVSPAQFSVDVDDSLTAQGASSDVLQIIHDARGAGIDAFLNYVRNSTFSEDYESYLANLIGRPFSQMDVLTGIIWGDRLFSETNTLPSEAGMTVQLSGYSEANQFLYSNYDTCFSMDESSLDTDPMKDGNTPACCGYMKLFKTDGTVIQIRDL